MSKSYRKDLTGQRFGRLKVIKFVPTEDNDSHWLCKCDCGKETIVFGKCLTDGDTKSCGCLAKKGLKVNLTGQHFGKLTVIEYYPSSGKYARWRCRCDCGNETIVTGVHLTGGGTKSCGCLNKEIITKHGRSHTKLYYVWQRMKKVCNNPKCDRYKWYGARGIKICDEWQNNYVSFHKWAMENGYQEGLTIDRIDVNGNYEPDNCRWVDWKTQKQNTTRNVFVKYQGQQMTITEAAERLRIHPQTLHSRYKKGDRGERLFRPVKTK